jgi:hypothetical protein
MKSNMQSEIITRESVLKLLSDEEVAKVCTAEATTRLLDGEEYLDLEHLDLGVQQAEKTTQGMGGVLPRRTVHKETWSRILMQVKGSHRGEFSRNGAAEKAKPIFPL